MSKVWEQSGQENDDRDWERPCGKCDNIRLHCVCPIPKIDFAERINQLNQLPRSEIRKILSNHLKIKS